MSYNKFKSTKIYGTFENADQLASAGGAVVTPASATFKALTASGAVSCGSTLAVTGATTCSNNFNVNGISTLNSLNVGIISTIGRILQNIASNNNNNVAIGTTTTLGALTTGVNNVAIGNNAVKLVTNGYSNTGVGIGSLSAIVAGYQNSAFGLSSLLTSTGFNNTAIGHQSGLDFISGSNNCFFGKDSGFDTSANTYNSSTAIGYNSKITASNQISLGTSTESVYCYNKIVQKYKSENIALGNRFTLGLVTTGTGTGIGQYALANMTTGSAIGIGSSALYYLTTGQNNIAIGGETLKNITTTWNNVGIGQASMRDSIDGSNNTALGYNAGLISVHGNFNSFLGYATDFDNSANTYNHSTAIGCNSKITASNQITLGTSSEYVFFPNRIVQNYKTYENISIGNLNTLANLTLDENSSDNVAIGNNALGSATIAFGNVGIGTNALTSCTTGGSNMALGYGCLRALTTGTNNCAMGLNALRYCTTGDVNTAVGSIALLNNIDGTYNTAVGFGAGNMAHGDHNTFIGDNTGFDNNANTYDHSCAIGYGATITSSNQIVIGTFDEATHIIGNFQVARDSIFQGYCFFEDADIDTLNVYEQIRTYGTTQVADPRAIGNAFVAYVHSSDTLLTSATPYNINDSLAMTSADYYGVYNVNANIFLKSITTGSDTTNLEKFDLYISGYSTVDLSNKGRPNISTTVVADEVIITVQINNTIQVYADTTLELYINATYSKTGSGGIYVGANSSWTVTKIA